MWRRLRHCLVRLLRCAQGVLLPLRKNEDDGSGPLYASPLQSSGQGRR